jgi:hypothetical protein
MTYVTKWTLTDTVTAEVYRFPINPNAMASIFATKTLETYPGPDGPRTVRAPAEPFEWSFGGHSRGKTMHDNLLSWVGRKHKLTVSDHMGRTFSILPIRIDFQERRSSVEPWRFTYEVRAWMLSQYGGGLT